MNAVRCVDFALLIALLHPGDLSAADWAVILLTILAPVAIIYVIAYRVAHRPKVNKLFDDDDKHE